MATYTSKTSISLNITLPSGKSKHISFTPITAGGSIFYTTSKDDIAGLEGHPKYGRLFVKKVEAPAKKEATKKDKKNTPAPTVVTVACDEDAKIYLCEKFGFSRTKLKRREDIIAAAKNKNITFEGI